MLALTVLSGCKITEDTREKSFAGAFDAPPAIWGEPETQIPVAAQYQFLPEASDDDGDVLAFTVVNAPEWAQFDSATGRLAGVPQDGDVGKHGVIVISVSDGNSIISLPGFSITVKGTPQSDGSGSGDDGSGDDGAGSGDDSGSGDDGSGSGDDSGSGDGSASSAPPAISGKPNATAVVGDVYVFQPQASDADGDDLSFSIVNKPSWASFNPASGRLEGTPGSIDIGKSNPIELSVTDGTSIAALTPFTITVEAAGPSSYSLSWIPPTENADGTPLTDLTGYRIYYGTAPGHYTESIAINTPGVTSHVIQNLAPGTYYLVMTSVNSRDMESAHSAELEFQPTS